MAAETISLTFNGFWRRTATSSIPNEPGVYVVYDGVLKRSKDVVALRRVLYIGESDAVSDRITRHERWLDWCNRLEPDGDLHFSFAPIRDQRDRAEAALIFQHKPPLNTEYTHDFPFDDTTMFLAGRASLLTRHFIVSRTPAPTGSDPAGG